MKIREVIGGVIPAVLFSHKPKDENWAITLYPFIFYRFEPEHLLRRHEFAHCWQVERDGWLAFYLSWLWWTFKFGYEKNPHEIQAVRMSAEHGFLEKRYPQLNQKV